MTPQDFLDYLVHEGHLEDGDVLNRASFRIGHLGVGVANAGDVLMLSVVEILDSGGTKMAFWNHVSPEEAIMIVESAKYFE